MAVSRSYLAAHWLSDAIAGVLRRAPRHAAPSRGDQRDDRGYDGDRGGDGVPGGKRRACRGHQRSRRPGAVVDALERADQDLRQHHGPDERGHALGWRSWTAATRRRRSGHGSSRRGRRPRANTTAVTVSTAAVTATSRSGAASSGSSGALAATSGSARTCRPPPAQRQALRAPDVVHQPGPGHEADRAGRDGRQ